MIQPSIQNLQSIQIPNPFKDDVRFEEFTADLFNSIEKVTSYDVFGRSGQLQHGVDVISFSNGTAIQCKLKSIERSDATIVKELKEEFDKDFGAFLKNRRNLGKISKFLFVTTFRNDTNLATYCAQHSKNGLIVEYWSWNRLCKHIDNDMLHKYWNELHGAIREAYKTDFTDFSFPENNVLSGTHGIINQLDKLINEFYGEINFIPLDILTRMYPFSLEGSRAYYGAFRMITSNQELFSFVKIISLENKKVSLTDNKYKDKTTHALSKTINILSRLTNNLIFEIGNSETSERVWIRYSGQQSCNCIKCSLSKGNFLKVFEKLKQEPSDLEEKLKLAYVLHILKSYNKSVKLFIEVADDAKAKQKNSTKFIASYNAKKSSSFVKYHVHATDRNIVEYVDGIDLQSEYEYSKNSHNVSILKYIIDDDFYKDAIYEIQNLVVKLRDQYFSAIKGGWQSNSNIDKLLNSYAQINSFLTQNMIVYTCFENYTSLVGLFIEGLMASHGVPESGGSRLEYFDDWIIQQILLYATEEDIIRYYNRYSLKEIVYQKTSNDGDCLVTRAIDTLRKYDVIIKQAKDTDFVLESFSDGLDGYINRLIILCGLCNIDIISSNTIGLLLIHHLEKNKKYHSHKFKYLSTFIYGQRNNLNLIFYNKAFTFALSGNSNDHRNLLDLLIRITSNININISLNTKANIYLNEFLEIIDRENDSSVSEMLVTISQVLKEGPMLSRIKHGIVKCLNRNFDGDIYYLSVIYGLLDLDEELLDRMIELAIPNKEGRKNFFKGEVEYENIYLDMLIDIGYKHKLDFKKDKFSRLWGVLDYYDWQLDMVGFDYSKFDINWVKKIDSSLKFAEMGKYHQVTTPIIQALRQHKDVVLRDILVQIQCSHPDLHST